MRLLLTFQLASDAAFGRGDGVPGLVDTEVEHDPLSGLPVVRGRVLKGLMVEACADLLFLLKEHDDFENWQEAARLLFGAPGSSIDARAQLRIGDGSMPADLQQAVAHAILRGELQADEVLAAATTIRRQTAIEARTGSAKKTSLRAIRAVLRDTCFEAEIFTPFEASSDSNYAHMLLAACTASLDRAGLRRNRGMGRLKKVRLVEPGTRESAPSTGEGWLQQFAIHLNANP